MGIMNTNVSDNVGALLLVLSLANQAFRLPVQNDTTFKLPIIKSHLVLWGGGGDEKARI